jgi:hypothetical protein
VLKSKWHQLVIVNNLMGLYIQKYNSLVIVHVHYLTMTMDDDDDDNNNPNTQSIYSFFFSYPFLILCSFGPHSSIITNLHNLLSLFYSFLFIAGWWLSYSCRCLLPLWENKNFHTFSDISCFHVWDIWHPQLSSVGHQDRALNTHESWTNGIPIHKAHIIHVLC